MRYFTSITKVIYINYLFQDRRYNVFGHSKEKFAPNVPEGYLPEEHVQPGPVDLVSVPEVVEGKRAHLVLLYL